MSPAPGGPLLYKHCCLLEEEDEDSEIDWVDEEEEEDEEEDQAEGHTLKVAIDVPHERGSLVNPYELNAARIKHSRMSFFLSGLLVMALTMLWLAFI